MTRWPILTVWKLCFFKYVHGAARAEAHNVREADLGAWLLALASFATKMCADLIEVGDACCGDRMAL